MTQPMPEPEPRFEIEISPEIQPGVHADFASSGTHQILSSSTSHRCGGRHSYARMTRPTTKSSSFRVEGRKHRIQWRRGGLAGALAGGGDGPLADGLGVAGRHAKAVATEGLAQQRPGCAELGGGVDAAELLGERALPRTPSGIVRHRTGRPRPLFALPIEHDDDQGGVLVVASQGLLPSGRP